MSPSPAAPAPDLARVEGNAVPPQAPLPLPLATPRLRVDPLPYGRAPKRVEDAALAPETRIPPGLATPQSAFRLPQFG